MPFFSRLTDIVTCCLTEMLAEAEDPRLMLEEIIREMEEGLAGAQRSVQTSQRSEERLRQELQESQEQVQHWEKQALADLKGGDENSARMALYRKKEAQDLTAGLRQQVQVAVSTSESLMTTYRALEARLAEARRRLDQLGGNVGNSNTDALEATARQLRGREVEDELAELKRRMSQS